MSPAPTVLWSQLHKGETVTETETEAKTETETEPSYVKVIVVNGRVVGAMLLGDTGLEEVFENLALDGTDVSGFGVRLLDPRVDLEGYFD